MRFVVLKHSRQGCETHYDLMIEMGKGSDKLATYSLPITPRELMASGSTEGKRIFDHDRRFLDYEGTVNNGRGDVEKLDQGTVETQDSASHSDTVSPCRYIFNGIHLKGTFEICNTEGLCRLHIIPSN